MNGDPAVYEGLDETGTARAEQAPRAVPAAIQVSHLTKVFGGRTAVSDVSFSVAAGELFGFLGPNGAGKTTTVRTLGTLIAPTSGSAIVAGIPLMAKNGPAIRSRISMMPESPGLYLRLTVPENLQCFAGLYELDDVRGRIGRALRAVNLEDRAGDLCGSLSKGLRQRVALARALLNDPAVLFLDEPTSGLDPVATREVHELHRVVARARGDHLPNHAPAGGGRTAVPSRGDPEHDACASSADPTSCVSNYSGAPWTYGCAHPWTTQTRRCSALCPGSRDGSRRHLATR